jgi:hypothetical protein
MAARTPPLRAAEHGGVDASSPCSGALHASPCRGTLHASPCSGAPKQRSTLGASKRSLGVCHPPTSAAPCGPLAPWAGSARTSRRRATPQSRRATPRHIPGTSCRPLAPWAGSARTSRRRATPQSRHATTRHIPGTPCKPLAPCAGSARRGRPRGPHLADRRRRATGPANTAGRLSAAGALGRVLGRHQVGPRREGQDRRSAGGVPAECRRTRARARPRTCRLSASRRGGDSAPADRRTSEPLSGAIAMISAIERCRALLDCADERHHRVQSSVTAPPTAQPLELRTVPSPGVLRPAGRAPPAECRRNPRR